jgi:N-acetylneuraminic acid mutarotase
LFICLSLPPDLFGVQSSTAITNLAAASDTAVLHADYVKLTGPPHDYWMIAMSASNAPSPRAYHTAVWTGSEMIIWGGSQVGPWDFQCLNDGGRYDPVANSWTPVNTNGAPSPRDTHTAVWTGGKMIIWGGENDNSGTYIYFNDGALYDPVADAWAPVTTNGAPTGRAGQSAVWTGSEMIIWGGYFLNGDTDETLNDGGRYDPASDTWKAMSTNGAPLPREGHSTVWTGNSMIVWGGTSNNLSNLNDGGIYTPASDQWTLIPTNGAPTPRQSPAAAWTGNSMIIWGGWGPGYAIEGAIYNPTTNSWTSMTTNGAPDPAGTAVWTGSEMVVWGGTTAARYNPAADAWTPVTTDGAPVPRSGPTAIWTGNEMIVWGGWAYEWIPYVEVGEALNSGGRYNPTGAGTTYGAPEARADHTAVWTGSEMIVWGGLFFDGLYDRYFNDGGRYNAAANTWIPMATNGAPLARGYHTAVWTGSEMIIWGGWTSATNPSASLPLNDGGCYDPAAYTWTPVTTNGAPAARKLHTAVWTGNEMIVWGGTPDGSMYLNSGGRYNPASNTWVAVTLASAPAQRGYHTAVWAGNAMIVWGGWNGSVLNDGGSYAPANDQWTPLDTSAAPAARFSHTAIWTGSEMLVWGGWGTTALNDGGRYRPSSDSWVAVNTVGAPLPRAYHTAVWTGNAMIVWGGWNPANTYLNDGAGYAPAADSWTAISPSPIAARDGHTAVWTGRQMVVWGGTDGGYFNDGWAYTPPTALAGIPTLCIAPCTNGAVVSWPYPSTGWVLEQGSDMSGTNWSCCNLSIATNAAGKSVTVSPVVGKMFFRLNLP